MTPYTLEDKNDCTLVLVDDGNAAKRVQWQPISERWHSLSGETFRTLQDVANSRSWAVKG